MCSIDLGAFVVCDYYVTDNPVLLTFTQVTESMRLFKLWPYLLFKGTDFIPSTKKEKKKKKKHFEIIVCSIYVNMVHRFTNKCVK